MAYDPESYQRNKEAYLKRQARYRSKPETRERYLQKAREKSREWYSKPENKVRRKLMNIENWKRQVKKMEEVAGRPRSDTCEICSEGGKIVFDHCHTKGIFRGWICDRCNKALGLVRDDIIILGKLISYLKGTE